MITNKRHELIMKEIKRKNAVTVTDLVDMLDTSESTIRRDLLEGFTEVLLLSHV